MAKPNITRFPFTHQKLNRLKPDVSAYDVRDTGAPGLALRVSPGGSMSFRWHYKDATGRFKVRTLGKFPDLSLSDARSQLEKEKAYHRDALDSGETESGVETVAKLAELFYERLEKRRKRPDEARRVIYTDIIPKMGNRKLNPPIKSPVVAAMIESVVDRGAAVHAGKVLDLTRQMFDFGMARGYITANPANPLKRDDLGILDHIPRERTLNPDEIRDFWKVLDTPSRMQEQTKVAFKLLLLTGVRTQELLRAKWENVQGDIWSIPVEDQKLTPKQARRARPFVIPLAPQAKALFEELREYAGDSPFVMATESGHYGKNALSLAMSRVVDRLGMPRATPHDLRRTLRTGLGETLKIEPHIAERCLNHSMGKLTETYDPGVYLEQRRAAMERWADQVDLYVNRPDNVRLMA